MSGNSGNTMNYDKIMSKKCCGIKGLRLNSRRFSVQRLRINFLYILRVFRRWKNPYRDCLRLLKRSLVRRRRRRRGRKSNQTDSSERSNDFSYGYCSSSGVRRMTHSNSFCSEAIADCLEFIKRNSVSVEDERKPILIQE